MKKTTEKELGPFAGNRDDFWNMFQTLKGIDLIDFTLELYQNDRMSRFISPAYLTLYIGERIHKFNPKKILITEAEKHLSGLKEIIKRFQNKEIVLTTQLKQMFRLLQLAFGGYKNVEIRFESIYTRCLRDEAFDYIYSLPDSGYKTDDLKGAFLTRDSDGIAIENMLDHLDDQGILDIIIPARITFAGMGFEKLRTHITDNFNVKCIYILPDETFKPVMAIKTYLFSIRTQPQTNVEIGKLRLDKTIFSISDKKTIATDEFLTHKDWRIELLLADDNENILRFKSSNLEKFKLKNIAEVFRGKSILKKDTFPGDISVLNISNIEDGEINYSNMDTIDEKEVKIKRYQLYDGDVVLSCRGTAIKSAVFKDQARTIIASANLIVIRPKKGVRGEYIKIFFESPVGLAIIKSFQRGTTVVNINYADIMEMEIPLLPVKKQEDMINKYHQELFVYKNTIKETRNRWLQIKDSIYNQLI
jgi:type I restriction-modification system DNA methylase subunit